MEITTTINGNTLSKHYELSEKEIDILHYVLKNGFIECSSELDDEETNTTTLYSEDDVALLVGHTFLLNGLGKSYHLSNMGRFFITNYKKNN